MDFNYTPTHPKANSYTSVERADEYLLAHPSYSSWEAKSLEEKQHALIVATRKIDTFSFLRDRQIKTDQMYRAKQRLEFPRTGGISYSGAVRDWTATSINDTAFRTQPNLGEGVLVGGAIIFYEGQGRGQTTLITGFASSTGTITFEALETPIGANTSFLVVMPILDDIQNATAEQAVHEVINPSGSPLPAGVKKIKIDDVEVERGGGSSVIASLNLSTKAVDILGSYISNVISFR
jgi:hypothetical protein